MYAVKTARFEMVHTHQRPTLVLAGSRMVRPLPPQPDVSMLNWIGSMGYCEVYADQTLIDELEAIKDHAALAQNAYYHATGSSALESIAKHKAILSAKELVAKGEEIKTGEYITEMGEYPRAKGGLEDVYISRHPSDSRCVLSVSGDYPVIFGIDTQALSHIPSHRLHDYGDGIRAGKAISLQHVVSLTVPYNKLPEIREWSAAHCESEVLTLSWDAAHVIHCLGGSLRLPASASDV